MGGRLPPLKIIEENICEDSVNIDKKLASGSSYINLDNHEENKLNKSKSKAEKIVAFEEANNQKGQNSNYHNCQNYGKKIVFRKKTNESKKENPLLLWKRLKIENIIPKNKLQSRDVDAIFFKGELLKYANPKPHMNNQICYRKFFVLDRRYLSSYKSKESFIKMKEPLLKLGIKEIQAVERIVYEHKINLKQASPIYNFMIQVYNSNITEIQTTK